MYRCRMHRRLASDDNVTYRRIPCRYRARVDEPYRFALVRIGVKARYFKIHSTETDTDLENAQFSAGTDYGGVRVFQKP